MIKIFFQLAISIAIILLAGYSLFTGDDSFLPLMQIVAGLMAFLLGIEQIKKKKKAMGIVLIGSSIVVWGLCILLYLI